MRILVTGATGFLGSHLVPILKERGHEIVPVGRGIERLGEGLDFVDCVVHLAAQTEVGRAVREPIETFEANTRGTWKLLEACRQHKVKRVIVASTDKAYGRSHAPYNEDTPLKPDRPYEASKACADIIAQTYASTYGMSVAVTRCVNLYGPGHLNFSTLIPGTIKRILHGEQPVLRAGGTMKRDFLYIDDACAGYAALVESKVDGPVCFGTGRGHTIKSVVMALLRIMKSDLEPRYEDDKVGELVDQWSSYGKAHDSLKWTPQTDFVMGLQQTVDWYRAYFKVKA